MTKPKATPTPTEPNLNDKQWAIYEHFNTLDEIMGAMTAFKAYMESDSFNKYSGELALSNLQSSLIRAYCDLSENTGIDI